MADLSEIRALIRDFISQENTSNTDFSNTELNGYANLGMRFLGKLVKYPRDMIEWQAELGKASYTLPDDAIIIRTAYFGDRSIGGDTIPLQIMPEEALKAVNPSWLSEDTASYGKPARIILLDKNTVLVNPTPNSDESASGKKLQIGYVYQPADMSADSDVPDIPLAYHDFIAEYAYYLCLVGKLNLYEKGMAVLNTVIDKAKKFENLIVKDTEGGLGFFWGNDINIDDVGGFTLR